MEGCCSECHSSNLCQRCVKKQQDQEKAARGEPLALWLAAVSWNTQSQMWSTFEKMLRAPEAPDRKLRAVAHRRQTPVGPNGACDTVITLVDATVAAVSSQETIVNSLLQAGVPLTEIAPITIDVGFVLSIAARVMP